MRRKCRPGNLNLHRNLEWSGYSSKLILRCLSSDTCSHWIFHLLESKKEGYTCSQAFWYCSHLLIQFSCIYWVLQIALTFYKWFCSFLQVIHLPVLPPFFKAGDTCFFLPLFVCFFCFQWYSFPSSISGNFFCFSGHVDFYFCVFVCNICFKRLRLCPCGFYYRFENFTLPRIELVKDDVYPHCVMHNSLSVSFCLQN